MVTAHSDQLLANTQRGRRLIALGFFLIFFALYVFCAARTNVGYGDSDELIVSGYLLSAAHPPGYTVMVLLTKLATLLPIAGSIAFRANVLSSFLHALTLICLFFVSLYILDEVVPSETKKKGSIVPSPITEIHKRILSLIGVSILGLSTLFWLYAGVIEVFALNNLLVGLMLLTAYLWRKSSSNQTQLNFDQLKYFFLTTAIAGIGLSNVQTYVLILPCLGLFWWLSLNGAQRRLYLHPGVLISFIAILGLCWFIPNFLLFWLNGRQQEFSWFFPQSWPGWWHMVTRQDYTGYIPEKQLQVAAYFAGVSPTKFIMAMGAYVGMVSSHFTILGFLIACGGGYYLWKQNRSLAICLVAFFLISGPLFAGRVGIPEYRPENLEYRMEYGIIQRQYLQGYVLLAVFFPLGLVWLYSLKNVSISVRKFSTYTLSAVILLWLAIGNWSVADQRQNESVNAYGRALLDSAEQNSVIVCFADVSCFSLFYLQIVEGYRPDVTVLIKNSNYRKYFFDQHPQYLGFPYGANPFFTADLISWNAFQRTTYLSEPTGYYIDYIGLEGRAYYLIPEGYLYKVVKQIPDAVAEYSYPVSEQFALDRPSAKDSWRSGFADYLANNHNVNGLIYSKLGNKSAAQQNFAYAARLAPQFPPPHTYLSQLAAYEGDPNYAYGDKAQTSQQLLEASNELIKQNQLDAGYKLLLHATFADPLAVEPRWQLAQLYLQGGFADQYRQQLDYILRYHPDYEPAKQARSQQ